MNPSQGLAVRGVVVRYGTLAAVAGVSLQVRPGEVLALLGPSGSGKSSLLRAIAGLEAVAEGDIAWDGESVVATPVHRREFGLMFQDGQLFSHRTVTGNVGYGLAGLPRAEREARTTQMLELVDMAGYARRSVSSLSGGQAQRVALARALAPRPRLMLLDEPLSALDRALREHLAIEIRRILRSSGATGIYVTHDQDEAFTVADRVGILIDGELARIGTPGEVWSDPRRADVAEFLGYGPLLEAADGELLAVAPGALTLHEPAGGRRVEVQVRDVRTRRGYSELVGDLDGQVARVRVPTGHDGVATLAGTRVIAYVDAAACPRVATGRRWRRSRPPRC